MYSYIKDVWPDDKILEHFNNKEINCKEILEHIENCDECFKKIYIKYNKNNISFNEQHMIYVKIFMIGLVLILILHLIFM